MSRRDERAQDDDRDEDGVLVAPDDAVRPNSAEMVPKVRPVLMSRVVYIASRGANRGPGALVEAINPSRGGWRRPKGRASFIA